MVRLKYVPTEFNVRSNRFQAVLFPKEWVLAVETLRKRALAVVHLREMALAIVYSQAVEYLAERPCGSVYPLERSTVENLRESGIYSCITEKGIRCSVSLRMGISLRVFRREVITNHLFPNRPLTYAKFLL